VLELEIREWIAYGLIATMLVGGTIGAEIFRRKRRWRKLRLAGDGEVKRRDAQRR
jgi:hypothetical protein